MAEFHPLFCDKSMLKSIVSLSLLIMGLQFAAAQAPAAKSGTNTAALPDGPGKEVVQKSCTSCHSIETITKSRNTADGWADVVSQMIGRGANISDDDAETVVEYLAAHFGPSSKSADAGAPQPAAAPPSQAATAPVDKTPVNVNKADAGALVAALGVTQAEADAIVQYRTQHGDFKTWQDVSAVPGVDADKIKAHQKDLTF